VSWGGDPHRILGIRRDASEAEIRRAYRALAKRHHPDAGQGSVARFLEIQAAYEALAGGDQPGVPSRPVARPGTDWARRPRPSAPRPRDRGPATGEGASGGPRPAAEPDPRRRGRSGDRAAPPRTGEPARGSGANERRRATLGSTSYDDAGEPFEPAWGGASWYGPSSGAYWTPNPREYADPRKHGPEYQARARRRAPAAPSPADVAVPPPGPEEPASAVPATPGIPGVVARILGRWRRGRIPG